MAFPKGKLLALVAVFAAIGVAAGTGAFTTVTAERTATVNVAGDSSALLALQPGQVDGDTTDTPTTPSTASTNGQEYVSTGDTVSIDLTSSDNGNGVNYRADTDVKNLLEITNQGSQNVAIWIEPQDTGSSGTNDADRVHFYTNEFDADGNGGPNDLGSGASPTVSPSTLGSSENAELVTGQSNRIVLAPGESITVHMHVDLKNSNGDSISVSAESGENTEDVLDEVVINADAEETSGAYDPSL